MRYAQLSGSATATSTPPRPTATSAASGKASAPPAFAREELFVSTKLAAEIKDYDEAVVAIDGSWRSWGWNTST